MRKQLFVVAVMVFLALPAVAHALNVTIKIDGVATAQQPQPAQGTVLLAGQYSANGKTITITACERTFGCSGGAARVFADDQGAVGGSLNKLVLTDVKVTTTAAALVTIEVRSSSFPVPNEGVPDFVALPPGLYPYAIAMNGRFDGVGARTSHIDVSSGNGSGSIGSLEAAPWSSSVTASFNQQALKNMQCPFSDIGLAAASEVAIQEYSSYCEPALSMNLNFNLVGPTSIVRLPNSVDVLAPTATVENGGGVTLANALAALSNPGGPKVLKVSLEPAQGGGNSFRFMDPSDTTWTVDREGNGESKTRAEVTNGGNVKLTAAGLCPEGGCVAPNVVNVTVFCGESAVEVVGALSLDRRGNGNATVATPIPCSDPAVVITEVISDFESRWIAAPAVGAGSF